LALAVAGLLSLQACGGDPTGQVVAVVNGEEITQAEINTEIAALAVPPTGDKEEIRRQILQQLVDRRLMAQVAKEEGFDRDPEFINRERKLREELLVQMYGQKVADTIGIPDPAAVRQFLAANPGKFAQRVNYTVDQVVFAYPSDPKVMQALEADKTLADVERTLARFKVNYSRGTNSLDSRSVPAAALKQIQSLPAGEPFVIPVDGRITVSVITGSQPVSTTEQEAAPLAAQEIRADNLSKALQARLDAARAKADVSYQDGFAPKAAPSQKKPD
jgi:EpsD family peptidyl-prolyl cis-trans isomerase